MIAGIYVCVNILKLKDKEILKKLGINILCILCITAFFWIPMLEAYTFTDYAVYQKDVMATEESFQESGLEIQDLLLTSQDATHVFELGIPILVMLCLSIFVIKKGVPDTYKKEYISFLILGILSTLMTIKDIPLGPFSGMLQIIQFKWRMLLFSNFFLAIICGINMGILIKKFNLKDVMVISAISLLYVMILIPFILINSQIEEIDKYTIGKVTENKKDVIIGMGKGEYLPVRANDNRKYIQTREDTVLVIKGEGEIKEINKNGEKLTCRIDILEEDTILEFPYIYYSGYKVTINGKELQTFESEKGFLAGSFTECSNAELIIEYKGTNLMLISKIISGITFVSIVIYVIYKRKMGLLFKEKNDKIVKK